MRTAMSMHKSGVGGDRRYRSFATQFIGNVSHDPSPFFLYVPFSHIHTPQYAMPESAGKSNKTGDAGHFYDALLEVDETIGTIASAIRANNIEQNTLVAYSQIYSVFSLSHFPTCYIWLSGISLESHGLILSLFHYITSRSTKKQRSGERFDSKHSTIVFKVFRLQILLRYIIHGVALYFLTNKAQALALRCLHT